MPLLHILNYINTYSAVYKTGPGQVGAVGTFYSAGNQSSISLGFNDAMWAKGPRKNNFTFLMGPKCSSSSAEWHDG